MNQVLYCGRRVQLVQEAEAYWPLPLIQRWSLARVCSLIPEHPSTLPTTRRPHPQRTDHTARVAFTAGCCPLQSSLLFLRAFVSQNTLWSAPLVPTYLDSIHSSWYLDTRSYLFIFLPHRLLHQKRGPTHRPPSHYQIAVSPLSLRDFLLSKVR